MNGEVLRLNPRLVLGLILIALPSAAAAQAGPTWTDIGALFAAHCTICHTSPEPPLGLRLDTLDGVLRGSENGPVLRAGNPDGSELVRRIRGQSEPRMPLTGPPLLGAQEIAAVERWVADGPPWLADDDIRLIRQWVALGAANAAGVAAALPAGARARFRGVLTGVWAIDGASFTVDGGTRIDKRPAVGNAVEVRGVVAGDGSVRATRLRRR